MPKYICTDRKIHTYIYSQMTVQMRKQIEKILRRKVILIIRFLVSINRIRKCLIITYILVKSVTRPMS